MNKKIISISLLILMILGSFINFYTTNFILSDVSNLTYGIGNRPYYIFASLPGLNLSFLFVLGTIFLTRILRHKEYMKRMSKVYTIIGLSFSLIGFVSSILAGTLVYGSFTKSNPFPGYLIISIILFSLFLIAGTVFLIFFQKKIPGEEVKRKVKTSYVFFTIILSVTIFYAYNRFGALIWSPTYIDWPTFYMTWPFYLSLLLPICILVHTILYSYNFYKKHSGVAIGIISGITLLFFVTIGYIVGLGMNNTTFISVISPAMGASRLLAKPIDIIANFVIFGIVDIYALIHSIKYYRKHKINK